MRRLRALLMAAVACVALACSDTGGAESGAGGAGGGQGSAGTGGGCPQGGQFYCGCTAATSLAVCVNGSWACQSGIPLSVCGAGGSSGTGGGGGAAGGGGSACASVTTLEACDARGDCHAVFQDLGICDCAAPGCCTHFVRCAAGDRARCMSGAVLCDIVTPYCEPPYTVSYTDSCYEGCARASECMEVP